MHTSCQTLLYVYIVTENIIYQKNFKLILTVQYCLLHYSFTEGRGIIKILLVKVTGLDSSW